ncbi:MAG: glutamate ligase domain-containing protein [Christensenellales bacterium]
MNVLGCAAVAHALGLSLEQIAAGVAKAEPVEHRLQLINPNNGTLVIDDAFNSNPNGTKAAMEVLSMYTQFRRICVTPGMVELGEKEEEENEAFGARMAAVCHYVVLVGQTRAIPIKRGLLSAGFPEENIFIGENLDQATEILGAFIRPGDVVLFENDLPDHYEH